MVSRGAVKKERPLSGHQRELLAAYEKKAGNIEKSDQELLVAYKERLRKGELGDQAWWAAEGFRASGHPDKKKNSRAKRDYGIGDHPSWSPYRRPTTKATVNTKRSTTLGDQAWWQQYGFKGEISQEKKRDYGNGIPTWSSYYVSPEPDPNTKQVPVDLAPDAFWFRQWGFRTAGGSATLTEEKRRDYGYGIPHWSPYHRPADQSS